jgi:N-acylneuraminate cytidylyltransferase
VIQYSLDAIKETDIFQKIVLSSDSDAVGSFAAGHGAVYFKRSEKYTHDDTPMIDALLEVIEAEKESWDNVCMVYACSPFVKPENIRCGLDKLGGDFDVVFSAFKDDNHAENSLIDISGRLTFRHPEYTNENSESWPITYQSAGQFYWAKVPQLRENRSLMPYKAAGVLVSEYEAIDIDTEEDWRHAELLYMAEHYSYELEWIRANQGILALCDAMEARKLSGKIEVTYKNGYQVKCQAVESRVVEINGG